MSATASQCSTSANRVQESIANILPGIERYGYQHQDPASGHSTNRLCFLSSISGNVLSKQSSLYGSASSSSCTTLSSPVYARSLMLTIQRLDRMVPVHLLHDNLYWIPSPVVFAHLQLSTVHRRGTCGSSGRGRSSWNKGDVVQRHLEPHQQRCPPLFRGRQFRRRRRSIAQE